MVDIVLAFNRFHAFFSHLLRLGARCESPEDDTEIACIETCLDAGESPKYPPILTKEYYIHKTEDLAKRFNGSK